MTWNLVNTLHLFVYTADRHSHPLCFSISKKVWWPCLSHLFVNISEFCLGNTAQSKSQKSKSIFIFKCSRYFQMSSKMDQFNLLPATLKLFLPSSHANIWHCQTVEIHPSDGCGMVFYWSKGSLYPWSMVDPGQIVMLYGITTAYFILVLGFSFYAYQREDTILVGGIANNRTSKVEFPYKVWEILPIFWYFYVGDEISTSPKLQFYQINSFK